MPFVDGDDSTIARHGRRVLELNANTRSYRAQMMSLLRRATHAGNRSVYKVEGNEMLIGSRRGIAYVRSRQCRTVVLKGASSRSLEAAVCVQHYKKGDLLGQESSDSYSVLCSAFSILLNGSQGSLFRSCARFDLPGRKWYVLRYPPPRIELIQSWPILQVL